MRFKLTHRDRAMLNRFAIVGETYTVVHHINNAQLQQVRNTYKVYKTVQNFDTMQSAGDVCWWKQCFKGVFACVSVIRATAKTNILF